MNPGPDQELETMIDFEAEDLDSLKDHTIAHPGHRIHSVLLECSPESREHLLAKLRDPSVPHSVLSESLKKVLANTRFATVSETSVKSWRVHREFWESQL